MGADDSEELVMALAEALAEVTRVKQENASLRTIALTAMAALSPDQMREVRQQLDRLQAGEATDVAPR